MDSLNFYSVIAERKQPESICFSQLVSFTAVAYSGIDPNNSNIIYVGNDLAVYVSPDGGTTWQDFNNGFWGCNIGDGS